MVGPFRRNIRKRVQTNSGGRSADVRLPPQADIGGRSTGPACGHDYRRLLPKNPPKTPPAVIGSIAVWQMPVERELVGALDSLRAAIAAAQ